MDKVKITTVYLRSGGVAVIQGHEIMRDGDTLLVYPDIPDRKEVTFNWSAVEFYKRDEVELPPESELNEIAKKLQPELTADPHKNRGMYL